MCVSVCVCVCVAEESDCLTEYEEDGMDTVREEEGEEEEDEADDPDDQSPGEWGPQRCVPDGEHPPPPPQPITLALSSLALSPKPNH